MDSENATGMIDDAYFAIGELYVLHRKTVAQRDGFAQANDLLRHDNARLSTANADLEVKLEKATAKLDKKGGRK